MVERKTSQDENAGLVHRRKDLVLASGISPSCVDVLKLRSQKDSSSFKLVTPFSNELIALKGGGEYMDPLWRHCKWGICPIMIFMKLK